MIKLRKETGTLARVMMHRFSLEEMNCENCKYYSALAKPREFEEGYTIYGYCFKDQGFNDKGYPVYIPEGSCKYFIQSTKNYHDQGNMENPVQNTQRFRGNKVDCENQMSFDDFPEVMP